MEVFVYFDEFGSTLLHFKR